MVGPGAKRAPSPSRGGAGSDLRFHFAVLGEATDVMLGEDELSVDADVEHPAGAADQLRLDAEFSLE